VLLGDQFFFSEHALVTMTSMRDCFAQSRSTCWVFVSGAIAHFADAIRIKMMAADIITDSPGDVSI